MLRPIIETILLCNRQSIALRRRTGSSTDTSFLFLSKKERNFRVILKYGPMNS
jgi:hypothetical protein